MSFAHQVLGPGFRDTQGLAAPPGPKVEPPPTMSSPQEKKTPHLEAVDSHADSDGEGGVSELLSGKITKEVRKGKKKREQDRPSEPLPGALARLADVYAAGHQVAKELEFKVRYAEQQIKDFCLRRFSQVYAATRQRPSSADYKGKRSEFLFVQTSRTSLTLEKVQALREMNVPIDDHTELQGIKINYDAIRRHGLEGKLKTALSSLGLPNAILEECFVPDVHLNTSFYDVMDNVVRESLQPGEELENKIYEVMKILNPGTQIRNLELENVDSREAFGIVLETPIEETTAA